MNHAVPSVSGVFDRIQRIEQRFGADHARPSQVVSVGEPFDPFGEVYQRALEVRPVASNAPAATQHQARLTQGYGVTARTTPATGSAHTHAHADIRGQGGIEVQPDLAPYGNGQVPTDALHPIGQSGHRLWAPAAKAWDDLVGAAAQAGFDLRITDSYRPYEEQVDLARRKGLYADGGLAAVPGTSNHGWGLAVDADVRDPALLEWLRQNGPVFGWVERVPREPWHWEYRPTSA